MSYKKLNYLLLISIIITSIKCSSDAEFIVTKEILSTVLLTSEYEKDSFTSFAANSKGENSKTTIFFYSKTEAFDFRLYETDSLNQDPKNYENYRLAEEQTIHPIFDDYMNTFEISVLKEKWILVSYFQEGVLRLSRPVKLKTLSKPTIYHNDVSMSPRSNGRAKFDWLDNPYGENDRYFEVLSDSLNNNKLLSGTYTVENTFTYYDTSNVVLNITENHPSPLIKGNTYNCTIMDISDDHWTNSIIEKTFTY